jgi:hypothetical protein
MEPESIKIDVTPRVPIVLFMELENIAPPPVSNFETLTATPRSGKGLQSEVAVAGLKDIRSGGFRFGGLREAW